MARKKSRGFQSTTTRDPRRKFVVGALALAGMVLGGGIGYAFGYFVAPLTDLTHEFTSKDASAIFFLYALAIVGLLIGAQVGQSVFRSIRRREQARSRRERYKDQLERFEREQAEMADRDDGYRAERIATASTAPRRSKDFESPWP